jgi:hypothetical protein
MSYHSLLRSHYEKHFNAEGSKRVWSIDPHNRSRPEFYVLEFAPGLTHQMWAYCTIGMSSDRRDNNLIEIVLYSRKQDESLVELLTLVASYHNNSAPLNLHHTVNIGRPWLDASLCDHGFISLPYLDGESLELFRYNDKIIHCYWFIPITKKEMKFKMKNGCDALEDLFEAKAIDYLNPARRSLV